MKATIQEVNLPTRLQDFLSSKISIQTIECAIRVESTPHDELLSDSAHFTCPFVTSRHLELHTCHGHTSGPDTCKWGKWSSHRCCG